MIPDFDEFMASLDPDETLRALAEINGDHVYQFNSNDPQNWATFAKELHQQAIVAANRFTVFYLRQYHEWLREHL